MIINNSMSTSPLNFRVVGGTAQPASPSENTIWVNTQNPITAWAFSSEEPQKPTEGMVWIQTGADSARAFNALKKNALTVCPLACKQYVASAWQEKSARTYKAGAWEEWLTYLIKNGDVTDVTGGWTHGGDGSISVDANGLTWSSPWNYGNGGNVIAYHNKPIDFSKYSKLSFYIDYRDSGSGTSSAYIRSSPTGSDIASITNLEVGKWYSFDLSKINLSGYLVFAANYCHDMRASEVYLS